ncbi:MAG: flagellar hook-length control protein FliK [Deltaproteobacteria bacterium]|nr:flagellar hook-length control protein FliK [Deltaproteobacteria bacterium]
MEIPAVAAPTGQPTGTQAAPATAPDGLFSLFFEAAVAVETAVPQSPPGQPAVAILAEAQPVPEAVEQAEAEERDDEKAGETTEADAVLQPLTAEALPQPPVAVFLPPTPAEAPKPLPEPGPSEREPSLPIAEATSVPEPGAAAAEEPQPEDVAAGPPSDPSFDLPLPAPAARPDTPSVVARESEGPVAGTAVTAPASPVSEAARPPEESADGGAEFRVETGSAGTTNAETRDAETKSAEAKSAESESLPIESRAPYVLAREESAPQENAPAEKTRDRYESNPVESADAGAPEEKPALKNRATTERLWGFWLRRGRGATDLSRPSETAAPASRAQPDTAAPSPPKVPLPAQQEAAEAADRDGTAFSTGPLLPQGPPEEGQAAPIEPGVPLVRNGEADSLPASGDSALRSPAAPAVAAAPPSPSPTGPEAVATARPHPYATPSLPPAEQVVRGVRLSLSREGDKLTVHLEPASLGKVQLVLARSEEGLAAHFRVETPQAQQALVSEAPLLRQALESKGIPLVEVFVDMNDQGRGGAEGRSARKGPARRPTERQIEAAQMGTPPPGLGMARGIDTRV